MIGDKQYWNKGLGAEAKQLLLYHGFYELGLIRIWSEFLIINLRSIQHAEKCGYKKEGVLRKACFKNGQYEDLVVMSIIEDEFISMLNKLTPYYRNIMSITLSNLFLMTISYKTIVHYGFSGWVRPEQLI